MKLSRTKHHRNALKICLTLVGACVLILLLAREDRPDPVYDGKRLSWWLAQAALNADQETRAYSVLIRAGTNGIPTYLHMLQSRDKGLGSFTVRFLKGRLFGPRASEVNYYGYYGFSVIGHLGSNAVPTLLQIYEQDISPSSRRQTLASIAAIGPSAGAAIPLLLREAGSSNAEVRATAVRTLGLVDEDSARVVPALITKLEDAFPNVRAAAAESLGNFGLSASIAVVPLIHSLKDPEWFVRDRVAGALGKILVDPEVVVPALEEVALNDQNKLTRLSAIESLGAFGTNATSARPGLLQIINSSDGIINEQARRAVELIDVHLKKGFE